MTFPMLANKATLVTGAAMGMGEATAKLFAAAGAKVAVVDYNDQLGQQVTQSINEAGGQAIFIHCDISKSAEVEAMVAQVVSAFGRLDAAVNNAAITPDDKIVAEFDEAYWDKLMSIDLKGTALCLKYELRQMIAQGHGGSIINISSVSGFRPQPANIAYVSAKFGVVGMTKVAAMENGAHGIRVNSVAPGAIDTPMLRGALVQFGLDPVEYAKQLSELGRFGQAEEIAQASAWLASDLSSFVTGTTLHVDGGYTGM